MSTTTSLKQKIQELEKDLSRYKDQLSKLQHQFVTTMFSTNINFLTPEKNIIQEYLYNVPNMDSPNISNIINQYIHPSIQTRFLFSIDLCADWTEKAQRRYDPCPIDFKFILLAVDKIEAANMIQNIIEKNCLNLGTIDYYGLSIEKSINAPFFKSFKYLITNLFLKLNLPQIPFFFRKNKRDYDFLDNYDSIMGSLFEMNYKKDHPAWWLRAIAKIK